MIYRYFKPIPRLAYKYSNRAFRAQFVANSAFVAIFEKYLYIVKMGILSAILVNAIGGGAIYLTGGILTPVVAPMLGFSSAGIVGGTAAAAAQAYYGNLVAGSIISQLTAVAMVAPIP